MTRVSVLGLALALMPAGIQAGAPTSAGSSCGSPTAIDRSAPIGRAVPLGGLVWLGVYPYADGYPTKVVVLAQRDLHRAIVVTGRRCADGKPLRFWYHKEPALPFAHVPVSSDKLRRTGTLSARFGPRPARAMTGGYFQFWAAGRWKIVAHQDRRVVATAIVVVATG